MKENGANSTSIYTSNIWKLCDYLNHSNWNSVHLNWYETSMNIAMEKSEIFPCPSIDGSHWPEICVWTGHTISDMSLVYIDQLSHKIRLKSRKLKF